MKKRPKRKIKRCGSHFVYIVECKDGSFYTGYSIDLAKRIKAHNSGKQGAWYTRFKRPVELVWHKEYRQFKTAFLTEKRIKKLTRKQKEVLVGGRQLAKVLKEAGK